MVVLDRECGLSNDTRAGNVFVVCHGGGEAGVTLDGQPGPERRTLRDEVVGRPRVEEGGEVESAQ